MTVTLANGRIATSTPPVVNVPEAFAVELEIQVKDDRDYALKVVRPEGASPESLTFSRQGTYVHTLGTLASGQESTVTSGGRTIRIVAGAEPGP